MATMAISDCLFLPTFENPYRFPVWCVLAKISTNPHNYLYRKSSAKDVLI